MPPGGLQETARAWEPYETELLLKERGIGTPWVDIGVMLGRSRSAVRGRYSRISSEYGGGLKDFPKTNYYCQTCKVCGKKRRGHICMPTTTEIAETESCLFYGVFEWRFPFDTIEEQSQLL